MKPSAVYLIVATPLLVCGCVFARPSQPSPSDCKVTALIASSAQAGFGAQNAAQNAAQSNASSEAAASSAPAAPSNPVPSYSLPAFSSAPGVVSPTPSSSFRSDPSASNLSAPTTSGPSTPMLREFIKQSPNERPQDSSVESYFRFRNPKQIDSSSTSGEQEMARAHQAKSSKGSVGRAIWHILDNVGVPMFSGDTSPDLDPRLSRDYVDPPMPSSDANRTKSSVLETTDKTTDTSASSGSRLGSPKIPESELQGTEFTPTPNVQTKSAP